MEINIGNKTTITSKSISKIMIMLVLITTIALMIINVLFDRNLITGMVIFSAYTTGLFYYFSKGNN